MDEPYGCYQRSDVRKIPLDERLQKREIRPIDVTVTSHLLWSVFEPETRAGVSKEHDSTEVFIGDKIDEEETKSHLIKFLVGAYHSRLNGLVYRQYEPMLKEVYRVLFRE